MTAILQEISVLRKASVPFMRKAFYLGLSLKQPAAEGPDEKTADRAILFYNGSPTCKGTTGVVRNNAELSEYCTRVHEILTGKSVAEAILKKDHV